MSAVHESSLTAAPSSVPPTVTASTTSAGAPVASSSVPSAGTSTGHAAATEDPVKALDHMAGEPSILDKAKGIAQPYLNKAQETTSPYIEKLVATTTPYLDNAAAKLEHLADRIEAKIDGTATSTGTTSSTTLGDKSAAPSTTTTGSGVPGVANPERRTSIVDQIGDKAQGVFASVSNTFSKLTSTIDDKTKSPTHPGIVTQLTQAVDRVSEKVDAYLDGPPAQHPAALEHPVQTTTNSVPHPTIPSDPSTSTSTSTATASSSSGTASHAATGASSSTTAAPSSSTPTASSGSSGSNGGGSSSSEPKVDPNVDSRF